MLLILLKIFYLSLKKSPLAFEISIEFVSLVLSYLLHLYRKITIVPMSSSNLFLCMNHNIWKLLNLLYNYCIFQQLVHVVAYGLLQIASAYNTNAYTHLKSIIKLDNKNWNINTFKAFFFIWKVILASK